MEETPVSTYDQIPYPAGAYTQSHIGRLEMLANLFGAVPPDIRHSRVLELGCADGSNLIPMACGLPESRFVGIDLSPRQVKAGLEVIDALGLKNIELRRLDIRNLDAALGTFDYVVAHGVYSWVASDVQEMILRICNERLAGNGVAYVSYNTYPGWRMRGMLRDMMLYHSRKFDDPHMQIQQARALIQWLGECVRAEDNPYGLLLKTELENMQQWQDTYFCHDSLEEINEPVYFHQFIEQAERHGLQYLAEAEFPSMLASNYAAPVDETLNRLGRDIIEMEQYMDFVRNRMFRQTLLCHRETRLSRSLGPWTLTGMHVAASLEPSSAKVDFTPGKVESFRGPNSRTLSSGDALTKAAMVCLVESWPQALPFPDLVRRATELLNDETGGASQDSPAMKAEGEALGAALLTAFCKGLCELHGHPGPFVVLPRDRPCACALARLQAVQGPTVTNRRHERVTLDSFGRQLLPLLDGQRDRETLLAALLDLIAAGSLQVNADGEPVREAEKLRVIMASELDAKLARLGRCALLVS